MARYEGAPKPNPDLESRIGSQKAALDELATRFRELVGMGVRAGLLAESENALFGGCLQQLIVSVICHDGGLRSQEILHRPVARIVQLESPQSMTDDRVRADHGD